MTGIERNRHFSADSEYETGPARTGFCTKGHNQAARSLREVLDGPRRRIGPWADPTGRPSGTDKTRAILAIMARGGGFLACEEPDGKAIMASIRRPGAYERVSRPRGGGPAGTAGPTGRAGRPAKT